MRRAMAVLAWTGVTTLAGCKVGPKYSPEPVIPPAARIGAVPSADSTRTFFDSLAVERTRDSVPVVPLNAPRATVNASAASAAAWLDIIRDTTLVSLVDRALSQNRDLRAAIARIKEFRADVGIARGPLLPSVTANASTSSNQVALGSFPLPGARIPSTGGRSRCWACRRFTSYFCRSNQSR